MIYHLCLDTCTWMYLANGQEPSKFLDDIEQLIELDLIQIIIPEIVIQEWNRNRGSILSHIDNTFKQVYKELKSVGSILDRMGSNSQFEFLGNKFNAKGDLEDIISKIETQKEKIHSTVSANIIRIENIFNNPSTVKITHSNDIILAAGEIALNKKAPIHKKNGFADAVILLTFLEYCRINSLNDSIFISSNTSDFCKTENKIHSLHPDLKPLFEASKCNYFDILAKALQEIDPELVSDAMIRKIEESRKNYYESFCECEECDGYYGCGNEIHFSESFDIINQNIYRCQLDEPTLFDETEICDVIIPPMTNTLQVGYCNHCSTQYIKCQGCGEILNLGEYDVVYGYNEDIFKCYCGIRYKRETEYDRQGVESEVWTIIDDRTEICECCGDEFIDKLGTKICCKCEDEFNDK